MNKIQFTEEIMTHVGMNIVKVTIMITFSSSMNRIKKTLKIYTDYRVCTNGDPTKLGSKQVEKLVENQQ